MTQDPEDNPNLYDVPVDLFEDEDAAADVGPETDHIKDEGEPLGGNVA